MEDSHETPTDLGTIGSYDEDHEDLCCMLVANEYPFGIWM